MVPAHLRQLSTHDIRLSFSLRQKMTEHDSEGVGALCTVQCAVQ